MPANHRQRGTCEFPDCGRPHHSKGWCKGHYTQSIRGQGMHPLRQPPAECQFPECGRPHASHGYCYSHARMLREGRELVPVRAIRAPGTCSEEECDRPARAKGLCKNHWQAARRPQKGKPERSTARRRPGPKPKSASTLPKGWNKPSPAPKVPSKTIDKSGFGLGAVIAAPTNPRTLAAGLIALRDLGCEDLAEALGVTPEHIRAEAERWETWVGEAA